MVDEKKESPTSDYNAAALINQRVQGLWDKSVLHSCKGDLNKWNLFLDAIWREFVGDLDYDEKKKECDYFKWANALKEIEDRLAKEGILFDGSSPNEFQSPTKDDLLKRNKQYKILEEKHIFLKRLEKFLGKGTKFKDTSDDYMDK